MRGHKHDTQNLYINRERIRGVQSCAVGWSAEETYVNAIGRDAGFLGGVVEQPLTSTCDIERFMVSPTDPIIDLFNSTEIYGETKYTNGQNYIFSRAQITNYSCECAVGSIPTLNFSLLCYGNSGGDTDIFLNQSPASDPTIMIASPGSVSLNVKGHSSNRIQSFNFQINVDRDPIFKLGSLEPLEFRVEFPIQVDCQFVLHVDDYESKNLFDFICSPEVQDLTLGFKDCESGENIRSFFMKDAKLMDYNQSGSIHEFLEATFSYKSYITNIHDLRKILNGLSY